MVRGSGLGYKLDRLHEAAKSGRLGEARKKCHGAATPGKSPNITEFFMTRRETFNALLIDLDGTLLDSAPDLASALNRLLAAEGLPALSLPEIKTMVGDGAATLVRRGFAARGQTRDGEALATLTARFLADYEVNASVQTRPYPGAVPILSGLRAQGWRLAVCTNKPESAARRVLADLDLTDLFQVIVGGDSLPVRKPDGRHLTEAVGRIAASEGRAPAAAVMLGDSRNDLLAARDAGLPVILVSHGYGTEPAASLGADRLIDRFDRLPAALGAFLRA